MIQALATLYEVSNDEALLTDALRAARWILANRAFPGGGFRHDEQDQAGPYFAEPLHVTVVGPKSDAVARSLFEAALAQATSYKRIEWWDRSEGPMPNSDVAYPTLARPAAFVCSDGACSLPVRDPLKLPAVIGLLREGP